MKPLILYYYKGWVDGVFALVVDLYYNLSIYMDVELIIYTEDAGTCVRHLIKNNNSDLLTKITNTKKIETDLIICSCETLYDKTFDINCDKIIMLDNMDLAKSIYGDGFNINHYIPDCSTIYLLSNPANILEDFVGTQFVYYQKFSEKRLNSLPLNYKKNLQDLDTRRYFYEIYEYKRSGKPHMEFNHNQFFENVGRLIFEHIYFNYKVNYNIDGMFTKDGLYYYLKLFGVDGTINHKPLPIFKSDIIEKLFIKNNDMILELI